MNKIEAEEGGSPFHVYSILFKNVDRRKKIRFGEARNQTITQLINFDDGG
jgi:hypothetical protein